MDKSLSYVEGLLGSFRLPTMRASLEEVAKLARQQNWDYPRFLEELCEREQQVRHERRIQRLLKQSGLPEGKTLGSLEEGKLSASVRRQMEVLQGGGFVEKHANVLAFGLPGRGKTHCLCAIARELILRHQLSVWFTPAFKLVQRLLQAKEELRLPEVLRKLDRFDVIIVDDIGYVQHDRSEMEVLFNFFAERYERGSLMITSNLPFSQWEKIFHDPIDDGDGCDRSSRSPQHHPGVYRREPTHVGEKEIRESRPGVPRRAVLRGLRPLRPALRGTPGTEPPPNHLTT